MKNFLYLPFLGLLLFSPMAEAQDLPRVGTNGNQFQTSDGKPVTLKGVSLCSLEWHNPLEQIEQITTKDKWAANVLRLPVQIKEWDRVGADAYIKGYLDPAVKMCREKNIYCIIDWHEIAAWNDPAVTKKLEDFWSKIAARYAADKNIIYEIFNEPTEPKQKTHENWLAWKKQMDKWVGAIRKDAPDTLLLIGSPHWSQMPSFAVDDPIEGKNLAYVLHLYPNYKITEWDDVFGKASAKLPLILTEWGWSSQQAVKGQVIYGEQKTYGEPLKAYLDVRPAIGWTAWSYDPLCGPAMLGGDKDMGSFVKTWLKEVNSN
jgi:endoglucanase